MKSFRYAHQVALDVACHRERAAARRCATVRDAHRHALAERDAILVDERGLREVAFGQSFERPGATIYGGARALVAYERCLAVFSMRRRVADAEIANAGLALAAARKELALRLNERDALERHRRHAAEAYALARARSEARELDDAASLAHEARARDARKDAA